MASTVDDADGLIERARGGDPLAEAAILGAHRDRLRRLVASRLDRRVAARIDPSDVIQEALRKPPFGSRPTCSIRPCRSCRGSVNSRWNVWPSCIGIICARASGASIASGRPADHLRNGRGGRRASSLSPGELARAAGRFATRTASASAPRWLACPRGTASSWRCATSRPSRWHKSRRPSASTRAPPKFDTSARSGASKLSSRNRDDPQWCDEDGRGV